MSSLPGSVPYLDILIGLETVLSEVDISQVPIPDNGDNAVSPEYHLDSCDTGALTALRPISRYDLEGPSRQLH